MVLTELINRFLNRTDSQIVEFVKKLGGLEHSLTEKKGSCTLESDTHIVHVETRGNGYVLNLKYPAGGILSIVARLEKGTYIIRPSFEVPLYLEIAPLNTHKGLSMVLATLMDNPRLGEQPGIYKQAAVIKKKLDKMEKDDREYYKEIFGDKEKPKSMWSWYRPLIAAAVTAAALIGVKAYYEEQADKQRDRAWKIERETRNLMFENELARKQELERIRDAEIAAKRKAEEEIRKKLAEENRIRTERWHKENLEKLKEIQTGMKSDFQKSIRESYKDAEITDLVWEAYCSNPVTEKDGLNWSATRFTVQFKDYSMKVSFRTDRTYHGPDSSSITYIMTAIMKNGKTIRIDQNGKAGEFEAIAEADKQAVLELVQKHNLTEVRKNVIDAVIEKQGHHRANRYNGRE